MPEQTPTSEPQNDPVKTPKRRMPKSIYNTTSMLGFGLAAITFGLIVFIFILDFFSGQSSPYMGLLTFVAMPPILIFGLIVGFVGMWRTARRMRRGEPEGELPRLDFNNKRQRRAFSVVMFGGFIFMAISAFGSYQAYEYTESVEFCGEVCHDVMKPEYVAYQNSPHARVTCVQCHIGSGATWYVKSKISGAYQVYSTIFNKYSKPIPTPVENLRPAKETCETCHWPSKFHAQKLVDRTYYASDEENTPHEMSMLMKIGGTAHGSSEGIHAHMYLDHEIYYIATDRQRQNIPYVEMRKKDGSVIIYRSTEEKITDEQIKKGEKRIVDCIDCHNRPSHQYPPPQKTVNAAMASGAIDLSLPEIKSLAVELLEKPYKTEKEAVESISKEALAFYDEYYAEAAKTKAKELKNAIAQIQRIYKTTYFPEMRTNWRAFPSNTDHMYSKGCFRCHDDKHVSEDGKRKISSDCNSCHTILSQGSGENVQVNRSGLTFQHPIDIGDEWKTTPCRDCHVQDPE